MSVVNKKLEPGVEIPKGFYYDSQLKNPITRMSLHPNTTIIRYFQDIEGQKSDALMPEWVTLDSTMPSSYKTGGGASQSYGYNLEQGKLPLVNKDNEVIFQFSPEEDKNRYKYTHREFTEKGDIKEAKEAKTYPYSKEPIASAILSEDFKVSIANSFSKLGGDPLGALINENKASLPIVNEVSEFIKSIAKQTRERVDKAQGSDKLKNKWQGAFADWLDKAANNPLMNSSILNRAVVFQGARFSFYGGTGVNFDNMSISYTIFPYWETIKDKNGKEEFKFVTVYDQLERLMPYVIGEFVPMNFGGFEHKEGESQMMALAKDAGNIVNSVFSSYGSWQLPPGGFEVYIKDVDVVQKGTMKLKLGSLYAVDNLMIVSCNFALSKHLIKDPSLMSDKFAGDIKEADALKYLTPAFCDIHLGLQPVSLYSKQSLIRFIKGEETISEREEVSKRLVNNLKKLDEENKGLLTENRN